MATKGREKKKEGKDEDEGVADVDDTAVSNLRLDFDSGQRILSQVHLLCQVRLHHPCKNDLTWPAAS